VLESSISDNGGRSCINASAVVVPRHGREIAEALAQRLGPLAPARADDPGARLSGFANPKMAEFIEAQIEEGLRTPGAFEATARYRQGPRRVTFEGGVYLRPTIVQCDSFAHPWPTENSHPYRRHPVPQAGSAANRHVAGVTAITQDPEFIARLLEFPTLNG
jgi:acyl-CoA reductase-like NAD-dependent aldehyde dehydrogenase